MDKAKEKKWRVKDYILWYTQFYDTYIIPEYSLVKAVNEEYKLSYQLNRFQDLYIDKMPEFKKYKGQDGYWIYERIDINPDPDWTLGRCLEFQELYPLQKWYEKNEEFLNLLEFAHKNNDKDFELYVLRERVVESMEKDMIKATPQ